MDKSDFIPVKLNWKDSQDGRFTSNISLKVRDFKDI